MDTQRDPTAHPIRPVGGSRPVRDGGWGEGFVGFLANDLRTPLTAIYGGTQLLLHGRLTPADQASVLSDIAAEAIGLHEHIDDLLAIARLERRFVSRRPEPILLQRAAGRTASLVGRTRGRRVEVRASRDLPPVLADPDLLDQVLRNLVTSATRSSGQTSPVFVDVIATRDEVRATVRARRPTGTATPALRTTTEDRARSQPLPDADTGLFVARALVEVMGGRSWSRPDADFGVELGFALPVAVD